MAKENITEEEELVEDFGDGYFAPYQQVFGVSWEFGVSKVLGYFVFFCSVSGGISDICAFRIFLDILFHISRYFAYFKYLGYIWYLKHFGTFLRMTL